MQGQLPEMMLEEVLQGPEWICWQSLVLQLQLLILILDPLPLSGGWWDLLLLRRQDFWFGERIDCWESDQEGVALIAITCSAARHQHCQLYQHCHESDHEKVAMVALTCWAARHQWQLRLLGAASKTVPCSPFAVWLGNLKKCCPWNLRSLANWNCHPSSENDNDTWHRSSKQPPGQLPTLASPLLSLEKYLWSKKLSKSRIMIFMICSVCQGDLITSRTRHAEIEIHYFTQFKVFAIWSHSLEFIRWQKSNTGLGENATDNT